MSGWPGTSARCFLYRRIPDFQRADLRRTSGVVSFALLPLIAAAIAGELGAGGDKRIANDLDDGNLSKDCLTFVFIGPSQY